MIKDLIEEHIANKSERTDLCELYKKYGSDKSTWHNYSPLYKKLFQPYVNEVINFLEVGLGTNYTDIPSNMGPSGKPGASLRAVSDYAPNWNIIGLDVDTRVLFQEPKNRISTFYVDQLKPETIKNLFTTEGFGDKKFDIIIDDGLHEFVANKIFYENIIDALNDDGIYIVEDILNEQMELFKGLSDEIEYDSYLFNLPFDVNKKDNNVLVVQKSKNGIKFYKPIELDIGGDFVYNTVK